MDVLNEVSRLLEHAHYPPIVTEREAARMISMSVDWLRERRYAGEAPAYLRIGNKAIRYERDELLAFMRNHRVENERPAV